LEEKLKGKKRTGAKKKQRKWRKGLESAFTSGPLLLFLLAKARSVFFLISVEEDEIFLISLDQNGKEFW
jgi:hypothetical protein